MKLTKAHSRAAFEVLMLCLLLNVRSTTGLLHCPKRRMSFHCTIEDKKLFCILEYYIALNIYCHGEIEWFDQYSGTSWLITSYFLNF